MSTDELAPDTTLPGSPVPERVTDSLNRGTGPLSEPSAPLETALDHALGLLDAIRDKFTTAIHQFKTICNGGGTIWNGEAGELLNLPLDARLLDELTPGQVERFGAEGNVRKLLGILNADVPHRADFGELQDLALTVLLGRGAKSLDALVLSLSLSQSERVFAMVAALIRRPGDLYRRAGALAAVQLLSGLPAVFAADIAAVQAHVAQLPDQAELAAKARERCQAAAIVRAEATLAVAERDLSELFRHRQLLEELVDTVVQGPEGAATRIQHVEAITEGFAELQQVYAIRLANFESDLARLLAVAAGNPDLDGMSGRFHTCRQAILLDWTSLVSDEADAAVACVDGSRFRDLPAQAHAKARLSLLAQAKRALTGMVDLLKAERDRLDSGNTVPADDSTRLNRQGDRETVERWRECLKGKGQDLLRAIGTFETAIRTEEASIRPRLVLMEEFVVQVGATVDEVLTGHQRWLGADALGRRKSMASVSAQRAQLAGMLRHFGAEDGPFRQSGGLRLLAEAFGSAAEIVDACAGNERPLAANADALAVVRKAARNAFRRAENGDLVRTKEVEIAVGVLAHLDRLAEAADVATAP